MPINTAAVERIGAKIHKQSTMELLSNILITHLSMRLLANILPGFPFPPPLLTFSSIDWPIAARAFGLAP